MAKDGPPVPGFALFHSGLCACTLLCGTHKRTPTVSAIPPWALLDPSRGKEVAVGPLSVQYRVLSGLCLWVL